MTLKNVTATQTGLTITESIKRSITRAKADTGLTITESFKRVISRTITDTGLTVSGSISAGSLTLVPGIRNAYLFGKTTVGATAYELAADTKIVSRFTCPGPCRMGKIVVWLDGLGSGVGPQVIRGVVYDTTSGALIAAGQEVTVVDGQQAGWVDLSFLNVPAGVELAGQDYDLGVIAGAAGSTVRLYGDALSIGSGRNSDTYSDGPADPAGFLTMQGHDLSLYAQTFASWALPADTNDFYIARLPFSEAQAQIGLLGGRSSTAAFATVGWHGTVVDRDRGSFAIVQIGGKLEGLLGERVKITVAGSKPTVVYAFVSSMAAVRQDITVTRRLFQALSTLGERQIQATVEVVPRV